MVQKKLVYLYFSHNHKNIKGSTKVYQVPPPIYQTSQAKLKFPCSNLASL